jgi:chitodextrinase
MFAAAGVIFKTLPALSSYGLDLVSRSEAAWARAKVTTSSFTVFETNCDDGDIKSGDADNTAEAQLDNAFVAAVYLYEATGKAEYKTFIESNYTKVNPYKINWWGPYWMPQQLALLRTIGLPSISTTVINNIRNQKAGMNYLYSYPTYDAGTDLYKSQMENDAFHWGHNQARSGAGHMNMDFITFNINTINHSKYRNVAEQYLHWLHGVNPMGMVMLSNMYNYGAEKCVNEIYHTWFSNGSVWDNALTSSKGPAPGYMPGGPNKNYTGTLTYLTTEPPQKAYKDWNADWPENSWEITEPSIYCQASYIMLLSRLMTANTPTDTIAPTVPGNLNITGATSTSISLSWDAASDNTGVTGYELYNGTTLVNGNIGTTSYTVSNLTCGTSYSFQVKAKDAAGWVSGASNTATGSTSACPITATDNIYTDALGSNWTNISSGTTVNLSNTSPVKTGSRSLSASFTGNGMLTFSRSGSLTPTAATQLRFWVYNNGKNGLKIFTHNQNGVKSSDVFFKPGSKKWVEVTLSMSQLGNPASIAKVTIQNNSNTSTSMIFDEVVLTNTTVTALSSAFAFRNSSHEIKEDLHVYPNPANNRITIQYQCTENGNVTIEMIDALGRKVAQEFPAARAGMNTWNLSLPRLREGIYYLQVIRKGERRVVPVAVDN